jgi:hypothetical protein
MPDIFVYITYEFAEELKAQLYFSDTLATHIKLVENTHFTSNTHFLRPPPPPPPQPLLSFLSVGTFGIPCDFVIL